MLNVLLSFMTSNSLLPAEVKIFHAYQFDEQPDTLGQQRLSSLAICSIERDIWGGSIKCLPLTGVEPASLSLQVKYAYHYTTEAYWLSVPNVVVTT